MKILLPSSLRPMIEPRLRRDVAILWCDNAEEAITLAPDADAAWLDMLGADSRADILNRAVRLKWLSTVGAGVESFNLVQLRERGTILTNGAGVNAAAVAEYAVLGVLAAAKRYDEVVRLTDRREWAADAPGKVELDGSRALIIGYGAIGRMIGARLAGFNVSVTGVTRSGRDGTLAETQWRERIGEFDWVILGAPVTATTRAMIGAEELAAMKLSAWLVNIGRGELVDQDALIAALHQGVIAGAFLDTVSPEPLPPDHPLWDAPNCLQSMHLSGRSQNSLMAKALDLFLDNLDGFLDGTPMRNVVDLDAGY